VYIAALSKTAKW